MAVGPAARAPTSGPAPLAQRNASIRVVFPAPPYERTATLRIASGLDSFIKESLQGKRGGILGVDAWSVNRAAPAHAVRTPPRSARLGRQCKQAAQPQGQSSSALTLATVLPASSPMASRTVTGGAVPT